MSDALKPGELNDEARRFLKADREEKEEVRHPTEETNTPNPPIDELHQTVMEAKPQPRLSVVIPAIVSMTFRLPASLAGQLVGVATERKLQRDKPFTQQDIIAEALRQWFVRNGYRDFNGN